MHSETVIVGANPSFCSAPYGSPKSEDPETQLIEMICDDMRYSLYFVYEHAFSWPFSEPQTNDPPFWLVPKQTDRVRHVLFPRLSGNMQVLEAGSEQASEGPTQSCPAEIQLSSRICCSVSFVFLSSLDLSHPWHVNLFYWFDS